MAEIQEITLVPDHQGRAGAVTWWRLSGVVDYDRLISEWKQRGLPLSDLPAPPSDNAALRRALEEYRGPRTLIRPLPGGGYAIVDEEFEDDTSNDPEYDVRFKVWLDMDDLEMCFDRDLESAEIARIHQAFDRCRRELHHSEVSAWMVRRAKSMQAISLRDTGGIYFIPEQFASAWSAFADIIASVSASRVYEIPALKNERAVEAIMEAVIDDAAASVEKLTKALDEREFTARGLRGKAQRCEAIADKLRLYEDLLGRQIVGIHGRVQELDARIAEMILMSEED